MNNEYKEFRNQVFSAMHTLASENEIYADAQMLLGASNVEATLSKQDILKSIDTEWVDAIEAALPHLDVVIRNPNVAIEDVEEVLPMELSRHINDRSVKHLAQHTNLILDIKDDDVIPQKILNVYREETYLTYENKFLNTLLARLSAFVDKRYRALEGGRGTERKYKLDYDTKFEHHPSETGGRNSAAVHLSIELTSPLDREIISEDTVDINEKYANALERIARINRAITSYRSSVFAEKMGRAYIRPPVIRTNAILKNKDMRECLRLWDYIEGFDKIGYSVQTDVSAELPSDEYVRDLYSTVALQYVNFYNGVAEDGSNRMIVQKQIFDKDPEFSATPDEEDFNDYKVYDSDYKRMVPVSRLVANPPKLSRDEKRIADAIRIALEADAMITARRKAEEEAKRRAEAEARRIAEEEARRIAEEEARIAAEEEARRLAELEAIRLAEEEAKRLAEEEEARELARLERLAKEADQARLVEEARLYALRMAAIARSEWKYAPEDDDFTGCHPLCPYKWSEYILFARKKKKQIKKNMDVVASFRDAQKELANLKGKNDEKSESRKSELLEICENVRAALYTRPKWTEILKYHIVE